MSNIDIRSARLGVLLGAKHRRVVMPMDMYLWLAHEVGEGVKAFARSGAVYSMTDFDNRKSFVQFTYEGFPEKIGRGGAVPDVLKAWAAFTCTYVEISARFLILRAESNRVRYPAEFNLHPEDTHLRLI